MHVPMWQLRSDLDTSIPDTGAVDRGESRTLHRVDHNAACRVADPAARLEVPVQVEYTFATALYEAVVGLGLVEGAAGNVEHGLVQDGVHANVVGSECGYDVELSVPHEGVVRRRRSHFELTVSARAVTLRSAIFGVGKQMK